MVTIKRLEGLWDLTEEGRRSEVLNKGKLKTILRYSVLK